jgi:hypothetical protein
MCICSYTLLAYYGGSKYMIALSWNLNDFTKGKSEAQVDILQYLSTKTKVKDHFIGNLQYNSTSMELRGKKRRRGLRIIYSLLTGGLDFFVVLANVSSLLAVLNDIDIPIPKPMIPQQTREILRYQTLKVFCLLCITSPPPCSLIFSLYMQVVDAHLLIEKEHIAEIINNICKEAKSKYYVDASREPISIFFEDKSDSSYFGVGESPDDHIGIWTCENICIKFSCEVDPNYLINCPIIGIFQHLRV